MTLTTAIASEVIVSRIKDLIILIDVERKILKVNKQLENILKYRGYELQGQKAEMLFKEKDLCFLILGERNQKIRILRSIAFQKMGT